jgi:DNA-binding response OmpR family regulator
MDSKSTPKGKKTALLVEDDIYITDILSQKLSDRGYDICHVDDGEKAVVALDDEASIKRVDIILLDLLLPRLHGFEVLKHAKANPITKDIPVLILSNLGDEKEIDEGLRLGATGYMVKANFTPDEIVKKIDTIVHQQ